MNQYLQSVTARAYSNIAFIKYWGNQDEALRLPANPSVSMNLAGLYTQATVTWGRAEDSLTINGGKATKKALARVSQHLDVLRRRLSLTGNAHVHSLTNIPIGAGVASSAAAFAAITVAAIAAAGREMDESTISALARLGSGSAARSIPSGFVALPTSKTHECGYATSIAPPEHWQLADVIAITHAGEKSVSSRMGHQSAVSSPLQAARIRSAHDRYEICLKAIHDQDFDALAAVVELDSNAMHAVMMTSSPPLLYWQPASLTVMQEVIRWRAGGIPVCYTLDAGPNVHCLCPQDHAPKIRDLLHGIPGVQDSLVANVGGGAHIIPN